MRLLSPRGNGRSTTWHRCAKTHAGYIRGSGYVVHSLEAALWCFLVTNSFEEAILKAVNLGDDADTTGAVCGQVAGPFYGESGIPDKWVQRVVMVDDIRDMSDRLRLATNAV